ncbi:MAG: glycosyltransferase family 4 protein [Planctomycetaceae bacterium]
MSATDPSELRVVLLAGIVEARGSSAYTLRLARRLADRSISATLVTPNAARIASKSGSRISLREYRRLDAPFWSGYLKWTLLREMRAWAPHLVHIQSRRTLKLGQWLARRLGCPAIMTLHVHLSPAERLRVDPQVCRRIIAVSPAVRKNLEERGVPDELVTTIVSGVDVEPQLECPLPLDPAHTAVIGTAGPLETVKGVPYLLGAAQRVLRARPELEFLVAGAGPEEANLRRMARALEISHKVTFVPYALDFADVLAAMDIYCLPSLQQGLGTIMLEAMALARPVIATGVGGIYNVVRDGETGLIVPPQNSTALAQRMLELLDNPARARALGAAGRDLVLREFDVDRMVFQTAELYREVCACLPRLSPSAPS